MAGGTSAADIYAAAFLLARYLIRSMMRATLCLVTAIAALLLLSVNASNQLDAKQHDAVLYESYLNSTHYRNFPPEAINCRPRMQNSSGYEEPAEVLVEDLKPSKTVAERLHPRSTFSFNCPTSIECTDAGCWLLSTRLLVYHRRGPNWVLRPPFVSFTLPAPIRATPDTHFREVGS